MPRAPSVMVSPDGQHDARNHNPVPNRASGGTGEPDQKGTAKQHYPGIQRILGIAPAERRPDLCTPLTFGHDAVAPLAVPSKP